MGAKAIIIVPSLIGLFALLLSAGIYMKNSQSSHTDPSKPLPANCSSGQSKHAALPTSSDPSLKKLAEYEQVCHGAVTNQLMTFTAMPKTAEEASQLAKDMAMRLKEFGAQKITPLVVFEPDIGSPTIITDIRQGLYDEVLTGYFAMLKAQGITDEQMGTWALFPEANTPAWTTTSPADFADNVTKVAKMQKKSFPASKTTILLDSRTYPDNDISWSHGERKSLVPYVKDIPKGLVDSFGYQGFPVISPANAPEQTSQLDPSTFIPAHLAVEAAKKMNVTNVWLNTGTFKSKYAKTPAAKVIRTPTQRGTILDGIVKEADDIQTKGLLASVNLFAADKSLDNEQTDWSYWQAGQSSTSPDTNVFDTFVRKLRQKDIGISLYDH